MKVKFFPLTHRNWLHPYLLIRNSYPITHQIYYFETILTLSFHILRYQSCFSLYSPKFITTTFPILCITTKAPIFCLLAVQNLLSFQLLGRHCHSEAHWTASFRAQQSVCCFRVKFSFSPSLIFVLCLFYGCFYSLFTFVSLFFWFTGVFLFCMLKISVGISLFSACNIVLPHRS